MEAFRTQMADEMKEWWVMACSETTGRVVGDDRRTKA
jgi:hypothetical protein